MQEKHTGQAVVQRKVSHHQKSSFLAGEPDANSAKAAIKSGAPDSSG